MIEKSFSSEKEIMQDTTNNALEKEINPSVKQYWDTLMMLMPKNFYKEPHTEIAFYEAGANQYSANILRTSAEYDNYYGIQDEIDFREDTRGQLNFEINKDFSIFKKAPNELSEYTDKLNTIAIDLMNKKGSEIYIKGYGKLVSDGEKWTNPNSIKLLDEGILGLSE